MKKTFGLIFVFLLALTFLTGCNNKSSLKKDNENISKYAAKSLVLKKVINNSIGSFSYFSSSKDSDELFGILKTKKSEFDINSIKNLCENNKDISELKKYNVYQEIIFDDNTGIDICHTGDKVVISSSQLSSEYINFSAKYDNFDNKNIEYNFPNPLNARLFKENIKPEIVYYTKDKGFFTDKSNAPVKENSMLYSLL